ncbi:MAG: hypothetical protein A3B91_03265 [Candidatus Yanofskybacteria bacterium RIFCSPHIGHO2_02_FULL_41_29]|uniref:Uncharacterized protein n=1 Tax=Candidatus Yanofskybacteria bacterium RIFCSPHIGHO2_01_FULL_41_53 TaxID=1802663 RepID=A0A1F8EI08_9BACT|nr:MAG: hypothetical protein A2650_01090 [Candidatus Yanofskybacteria bacterium RIFCSPHIGHO2_01_FULL_41_53]OGN10683.1 MAG: hypothetical protein A3B91_03265 [Candidatus Yanofskybacteria bacterium RIFCSPHIGHO2_02_FULL_41_29]OGN18131.1 MAG: hypothetical protein A3F48_02280 [Candidatus Yanofskybacteria bacterium RIFCSPHIGHO2_12_FULL_41_9]OGN24059.1 MAG: hypothetical protein A2916_04865 [Candidatus Yanofskybacteria bacterium RIFCSPLOWO2_01_FULL_41_67]OGN30482.1 MAG: hypothetical protein A3H54_00435 
MFSSRKLFCLGLSFVSALPAFFSDSFASYLFYVASRLRLGDLNIFSYFIFILGIYMLPLLLIEIVASKLGFFSRDVRKFLYLNILGVLIAYAIYIVWGISSLRNLVGGL